MVSPARFEADLGDREMEMRDCKRMKTNTLWTHRQLIVALLLLMTALPASAVVINEQFIYPSGGDGYVEPLGHLAVSDAAGVTAFMVGNNSVTTGWGGGSFLPEEYRNNDPEGLWQMVVVEADEKDLWGEYVGTSLGDFITGMPDETWNTVFDGEYNQAMVFYGDTPLGSLTYDFVFTAEYLASPFVALGSTGYVTGQTIHGSTPAPTPVPEPGTLLLLALGLLAIFVRRGKGILGMFRGARMPEPVRI